MSAIGNLLGAADGGRARLPVPHISAGQNLVATNAVCSAAPCECAPRSPPSRFIQCPRRPSALYSRSGASHKSLGALKFVVGRPRAPPHDPGAIHRTARLRLFAATRLHLVVHIIVVIIDHFSPSLRLPRRRPKATLPSTPSSLFCKSHRAVSSADNDDDDDDDCTIFICIDRSVNRKSQTASLSPVMSHVSINHVFASHPPRVIHSATARSTALSFSFTVPTP